MTEIVITVTNVILAIEIAAAAVVAILNVNETRFLEQRVRPLLNAHEELPLFNALSVRARSITAIGIYLLLLTAIGATGISLTTLFPPLRAINGALLLYLIAGPRIYGMALRQRARSEHSE